ncbi:hypothetical protein FRC09_010643 [Ceratobasidium sp. 395]|nr:hypothetical protein FRC09_010643 [Ceratobasidium sp. 395]
MESDPYSAGPGDTTANLFHLHSQTIIDNYLKKLQFDTPLPPAGKPDTESRIPPVTRVAVIGGGVSGLQVAMRLSKAGHKVDVFEATERTGGRLYTFHFGGGEWNYFDVGAMRFPHISVMQPTLDLFAELGLPLLKYYMPSDDNTILLYNNIRVKRKDSAGVTFNAQITKGGSVPDYWVNLGVTHLMRNVYGRFLDALRKDYAQGYKEVMVYDNHSTRSLMAFVTLPTITDPVTGLEVYPCKEPYPVEVINWLELMTFSVGWFDRSFSETIFELLAFSEDQVRPWSCVKDGSEQITNVMVQKMLNEEPWKDQVQIWLSQQVTAINFDKASGEFTISATPRPRSDPAGKYISASLMPDLGRKYSHVVLAVSPQAMRYIDLSTCQLDYGQRQALLALRPGPATKVGMIFNYDWWTPLGIVGSQSQTDLPVRTVVYPSYGPGISKVIIASYCWTQDAQTMAALMQGSGTFDETRLKNAILSDLAAIHDIPLTTMESYYAGMYAYDWSHNPQTMGAYAFFGPGEFVSLYENLTRPAAQGGLHFAGEAISTCHAWVAGALDAANRVVGQIDPKYMLPSEEPQNPKDYPTYMSREHLLKQLQVSAHLQQKEFGQLE